MPPYQRPPTGCATMQDAVNKLGIAQYQQIVSNPDDPRNFWFIEYDDPSAPVGGAFNSGRAWNTIPQYAEEAAKHLMWEVLGLKIDWKSFSIKIIMEFSSKHAVPFSISIAYPRRERMVGSKNLDVQIEEWRKSGALHDAAPKGLPYSDEAA
ncbi:hypothetical protein CC86DRAFT_454144 [Ophiobolus disseminans]|uniref:Uncharacterized protein n=1 Tax=Ophiobolus disseminans TaxID=1469910 RepID=A0A6A7AA04_9PLEO|nr:hypothetical protein CC86DRAFT_454144 [Ophiobolus disseminans]